MGCWGFSSKLVTSGRIPVSGPCARYGSPKFPPLEKGRETAMNCSPRQIKKEKEKKRQALLGEATLTSCHMVQLSELFRHTSFMRASFWWRTLDADAVLCRPGFSEHRLCCLLSFPQTSRYRQKWQTMPRPYQRRLTVQISLGKLALSASMFRSRCQ